MREEVGDLRGLVVILLNLNKKFCFLDLMSAVHFSLCFWGLNLRFYIFISMQFVYWSGTRRCWIDPLVDFTAQVSISDLCVKL
jgi:hypothetical protein